jgi:hypothetical protein
MSDYEYKECIRKGKKKVVHKKEKKYEAKAQKKNRIQSQRYKQQNTIVNHQDIKKSALDELVDILKKCKITEWSLEYEDYYQKYHCYENETLKEQYDTLQYNIAEWEYDEKYEEERDYWLWESREYMRCHKYEWW